VGPGAQGGVRGGSNSAQGSRLGTVGPKKHDGYKEKKKLAKFKTSKQNKNAANI